PRRLGLSTDGAADLGHCAAESFLTCRRLRHDQSWHAPTFRRASKWTVRFALPSQAAAPPALSGEYRGDIRGSAVENSLRAIILHDSKKHGTNDQAAGGVVSALGSYRSHVWN